METLEGFPSLPAMVRAEQSSAAPHALAAGQRRSIHRGEPKDQNRRIDDIPPPLSGSVSLFLPVFP
jgi:hypothetical protein